MQHMPEEYNPEETIRLRQTDKKPALYHLPTETVFFLYSCRCDNPDCLKEILDYTEAEQHRYMVTSDGHWFSEQCAAGFVGMFCEDPRAERITKYADLLRKAAKEKLGKNAN